VSDPTGPNLGGALRFAKLKIFRSDQGTPYPLKQTPCIEGAATANTRHPCLEINDKDFVPS
jgi:hypothetical protein